MIVGIPIIQLVLFGFAINSDPKHLPTMLLDADRSEFSRSIVRALANSDYFAFVGEARGRGRSRPRARHGRSAVRRHDSGRTSRARLMRGERPAVLVEADATDPAATGNAIARAEPARAIGAARTISRVRWRRSRRSPAPFDVRRASRATTPRRSRSTTSCPACMGVILTMTMVLMTGLAITRERERGTMENLLATPATALEVMIGQDRALCADRPRPGDAGAARWRALLFDVPMHRQPRRCSISPCCCSSPPT